MADVLVTLEIPVVHVELVVREVTVDVVVALEVLVVYE